MGMWILEREERDGRIVKVPRYIDNSDEDKGNNSFNAERQN